MTVTVYTKKPCVQCDRTKRALTNKGIEFEEVDMTKNPDAFDKIVEMGFMQAPVVITDNDAWSGFNPDKIDELASLV